MGATTKSRMQLPVSRRKITKVIIWKKPVSDLLYVGHATERKLKGIAILTIGDLARRDPALLKLSLGKWGLILSDFARGMDTAPVRTIDERSAIKSIGNGVTTPRDITSADEAKLVYICWQSPWQLACVKTP